MKQHKIIDERVVAQQRKLSSNAFQILFFGLMASIVLQEYLLKAPFSQYAVECILWIASGLYILIGHLVVGTDLFPSRPSAQKSVLVNSLLCGLVVMAMNAILNHEQQGNLPSVLLIAAITFCSATVIAFIPLELAYLANKKRQKAMDAHLAEDEE